MRLAFLVNDVAELVATQTTAMLMETAVNLGWEAIVCDVYSFAWRTAGGVSAKGRTVSGADSYASTTEFLKALKSTEAKTVDLSAVDLLMIRTNPARDKNNDWAHQCSLHFARQLKSEGVKVVNDPDGLANAANKLYLARFSPEVQPKTLVTQSEELILDWLHNTDKRLVIKPLQGTRGQGVFAIDKTTSNLRAIIEIVTRDGFAMVQEYIPGAENGDIRVVLLKGEILEIDGEVAAIGRVPAKGDFRSNLHAGGHAIKPEISDDLRSAIAQLGPTLRADGLDLVGVDFITDKLVEINVFSTGGLYGAQNFTGKDFCKEILVRLNDER
ncbi:MAG: ATP-grasp domain-containing protein [Planctomycetota bacterium]|nr:ATP-grasp domain-containing protein [Planctomycetota bacterium]